MMRKTDAKELLPVYFDRQWRSFLESKAVNVDNSVVFSYLQIDRQWRAIYILTPKLIERPHFLYTCCRESSQPWQFSAELLAYTVNGISTPCAFT